MAVQLFLGHHKGGTRFVGNVMTALAQCMGREILPLSNPKWFGFDIARAIESSGSDPLIYYMNADYELVRRINTYRAFHVVRDPRDIAVSAYFSHLHSHSTEWWPELAGHRARLQQLNLTEGLLADLEFTDALPTDGFEIGVFRCINDWRFDDPDILELRFEDLVRSPAEILAEAFSFIGLLENGQSEKIELLRDAVDANSFTRLSGGRSPGERNDRHHYRNGVPGNWRNVFEAVHARWFEERYPGLIQKLGYDAGVEWQALSL